MIPDIKLHEVVKSCLKAIRVDYAEYSATPSNTILYYLLNSSNNADTGRYKWYEQAVEIFINRNEHHPKYLDTRLFFDRERALIPTIHIMMSGESKGSDSIGIGLGSNPEQVIGDSQRGIHSKYFDINANIVITSDNTFETVLIYHVLKSMLVSILDHIQLLGFMNPILGGRDINISQDLVPNGVYSRALNFSAGYELTVPQPLVNKIVSSVWLQISKINDQTLTPPIGPGPVTPSLIGDDTAEPL